MSISSIPNELILYMTEIDTKVVKYLRPLCRLYNELLNHPKLRPRQYTHPTTIIDKLNKYNIVIDTSIMGSGKTHTTSFVCWKLGFIPFVICEPSIVSVWNEVLQSYGITNRHISTYASLSRGQRNEYIKKNDDKYTITECFSSLLRTGKILLIIDECDNIKNKSGKTIASALISKNVLQYGGKIICLSASPFDKAEHIVNVSRVLGWITEERIARHDIQNGYILEGGREFIHNLPCDLSYLEREEIISRIDSKNKYDIFFRTFIDYSKPKIMVCMPKPYIEKKLTITNNVYNVTPMQRIKLEEFGYKLELGYVNISDGHRTNNPILVTLGWNMVSKALKNISIVKGEVVARIANELLTTTNKKVVIVFYHIDPINYLSEYFKSYNPIVLVGKVAAKQRSILIKEFNNNKNKRLMIANLAVISKGVSLHDVVGDSPRHMLVIPDYRIILMHQVTRRIYRDGQQSDAVVSYVYTKAHRSEAKVLDNLAKKSEVLKELRDEKLEDILYPSEHPFVDETN
ncbi:DEAD/SNF2 helicase [Orpheovirus IHUMI-LCC2]|uniref:DEAD/SNF2 helicase n=1 Tax=Orpheovirus IHUMI-LCC2 TaxID=2023057 RepID=A0A2I2L5H8_9VIRU|nr:DEAD/SNF2 helicase [Orpheovirus IHUMI-LCC2]SNW62802.1 DEAD/SNF2 helicase [Orpheovirus IHUMI-LCC2]